MLTELNESLRKQQENVELIENDPTYNEKFDNQMVSLDSGMIQFAKKSQVAGSVTILIGLID